MREALFGTESPVAEQQMIQIAAEMQMYRGPLPPAAEVCAWEEVCPGSAERILGMAENNNRCNNANKDKIIQHNIRFENWGLALGFCALIIDIGAVVYCTMRGHDAVAAALLTLAVMGVIAKFIPVKVDPQKQD